MPIFVYRVLESAHGAGGGATGEQRLLFSVADVVKIPWPQGSWEGAKHWFNHLLYAPDGSRFCFLNRWKAPGDKSHTTRMITMNPDGTEPYVLIAPPMASHFIWRDPKEAMQVGADLGTRVVQGRPLPRFVGRIESVRLYSGEAP